MNVTVCGDMQLLIPIYVDVCP